MAWPTLCETRWAQISASFERQHDALIASHPDCKDEIGLVHSALITVGRLVHVSPHVNGNGAVWIDLTTRAEADGTVLCKHLHGKTLVTFFLLWKKKYYCIFVL
jgi:hypothetical protein